MIMQQISSSLDAFLGVARTDNISIYKPRYSDSRPGQTSLAYCSPSMS